MNDTLQELRKSTLECTFCGACQTVCPVYAKMGGEWACSRGRLFQLRCLADKQVEPNQHLAASIATCTLCMACAAQCPSHIHSTELFMRFRHMVSCHTPLPLAKRVAFTGLTSRKLFDFCLSVAPWFQGLFLKKMPDGPGRMARIPLPAAGLTKRRVLPALSSKPLRRRVPAVSSPQGKVRARVAFFPGCMLHYVYPEAGKSVIDVLLANGVEVVLPKGTGCCGTPAITSGDFAAGRLLAETNINALESMDVDCVITACATCGTALTREYGLVLEESPRQDAWGKLKNKVFDISAFLVQLGFSREFHDLPQVVTYHDPCHLVRGMNVAEDPRTLLRAIPGLQFREMHDAQRCCGCAGTFSVTHYPLASRINDDKVHHAQGTGAAIVATGCSACRMHIVDGLERNHVPMKVLHTAQLLDMAYKGVSKNAQA